MSSQLKAPMTRDLVWAKVMRPRTPLVYLDLNTIIFIARTLQGNSDAPAGFDRLYETLLRAKDERRATFPLGEAHLWEVNKIADPRQRRSLADVLESLSDFNYLLGRLQIAELEFEAGMSQILREEPQQDYFPLVRPTFGQVFGIVGGMNIRDADGGDASEAVRARMGEEDYRALRARMNLDVERHVLRGPTDAEVVELRKDPRYRPEIAAASRDSRLGFELDTKRVLDADPKWRRGRLRDVVGAREVHHEWNDLLARLRARRIAMGLGPFEPTGEQFRTFLGSMPHTQVAISIKTRLHRDPAHRWTPNDVSDIDAMSVAYPYCDAVFPDKAIRSALLDSKELRAIDTFVPRRAAELTEWVEALPALVEPDLLVPHPPAHPVS